MNIISFESFYKRTYKLKDYVSYSWMIGYKNNSNVCYFNSMMASFLSCDAFVTKSNDNGLKDTLLLCGDDLSGMIKALPWTHFGIQECAHETMVKIIDYFKLEDIFQIELNTYNLCKCTDKPEPKVENISYIMSDRKVTAENLVNIQTDGDICSGCQTNYRHHYIINKLSNILIVVLNKYNTKSLIEFDEDLVFEKQDGTKTTYTLKAQIEHRGNTHSGHYHCIIKRGVGYYHVDDQFVCNASFASTQDSYILLYETKI
jgi:ubiquitin C-terminal hydrolase